MGRESGLKNQIGRYTLACLSAALLGAPAWADGARKGVDIPRGDAIEGRLDYSDICRIRQAGRALLQQQREGIAQEDLACGVPSLDYLRETGAQKADAKARFDDAVRNLNTTLNEIRSQLPSTLKEDLSALQDKLDGIQKAMVKTDDSPIKRQQRLLEIRVVFDEMDRLLAGVDDFETQMAATRTRMEIYERANLARADFTRPRLELRQDLSRRIGELQMLVLQMSQLSGEGPFSNLRLSVTSLSEAYNTIPNASADLMTFSERFGHTRYALEAVGVQAQLVMDNHIAGAPMLPKKTLSRVEAFIEQYNDLIYMMDFFGEVSVLGVDRTMPALEQARADALAAIRTPQSELLIFSSTLLNEPTSPQGSLRKKLSKLSADITRMIDDPIQAEATAILEQLDGMQAYVSNVDGEFWANAGLQLERLQAAVMAFHHADQQLDAYFNQRQASGWQPVRPRPQQQKLPKRLFKHYNAGQNCGGAERILSAMGGDARYKEQPTVLVYYQDAVSTPAVCMVHRHTRQATVLHNMDAVNVVVVSEAALNGPISVDLQPVSAAWWPSHLRDEGRDEQMVIDDVEMEQIHPDGALATLWVAEAERALLKGSLNTATVTPGDAIHDTMQFTFENRRASLFGVSLGVGFQPVSFTSTYTGDISEEASFNAGQINEDTEVLGAGTIGRTRFYAMTQFHPFRMGNWPRRGGRVGKFWWDLGLAVGFGLDADTFTRPFDHTYAGLRLPIDFGQRNQPWSRFGLMVGARINKLQAADYLSPIDFADALEQNPEIVNRLREQGDELGLRGIVVGIDYQF